MPTLQRRKLSRSECIRKITDKATDESPIDTDVVICYHGDSSTTDRNPPHYGYWGHDTCRGANIDCFWMRAPNTWKGYGDAGDDNIAMNIDGKCTYNRDTVTVECK
ncbi:putative fungal zinc cluster transcription factor [Pseudozyma hubeiensis]|nr:putative fungal zinc cluster transcription factor [Pseudozyma hubeiensis]